MTRPNFRSPARPSFPFDPRLGLALALSVLSHVAPLLPPSRSAPLPAMPAPLQAKLSPPALPAPPELRLPDPAPPEPGRAARKPPSPPSRPSASAAPAAPAARPNWQEAVRQQFRQQQQAGAFYPPEAIARGLEGEALVLMVLAPEGHVAAARIEQSSGHALLDEAALRAVRALRSLPAEAPREALLPVRFRLR